MNGGDGKRLPVIRSKKLGKMGPAFGVGAGCGFGFGLGLIGGAGLGPGIPGLQFGFGFGAGCGVGVGLGYGVGRGVAFDGSRKYSNVGKLSRDDAAALLDVFRDDAAAVIDELVINTKKLVIKTSKEIEKWRR